MSAPAEAAAIATLIYIDARRSLPAHWNDSANMSLKRGNRLSKGGRHSPSPTGHSNIRKRKLQSSLYGILSPYFHTKTTAAVAVSAQTAHTNRAGQEMPARGGANNAASCGLARFMQG